MFRKASVFLVLFSLIVNIALPVTVHAEGEDLIAAPHGVLMEASTGTIIYEKDKDTKVYPASITKIMTLVLIFDEIAKGTLHMEDEVTTSAYAKSMGGSQVYLEEGEKQTVETMIKCIVIASGNDASVAMAEHIAGSEAEFVKRMNERAAGLNMTGTHFEDCCGLTESTNHYTTAYDVALMSRELVTKYPKILDYSSIWMENITHNTAKGSSEFLWPSDRLFWKIPDLSVCVQRCADTDGAGGYLPEMCIFVFHCPEYCKCLPERHTGDGIRRPAYDGRCGGAFRPRYCGSGRRIKQELPSGLPGKPGGLGICRCTAALHVPRSYEAARKSFRKNQIVLPFLFSLFELK